MADGKIRKDDLVEKGAPSVYKDLESQAVKSIEAITVALDGLAKKQSELGVSTKDIINLEKQQANELKKLEAEVRKLEQAKKAREAQVNKESALNERLKKQRLQEQKDTVRSEQLLNKLAKANQNNANAYTRLNAELKKVETQYKNLSAKQAQGIALSVKEQGQLKALTTKLAMLSGAYKKVDADMLRTTGGVRRASSSFDSLGFSVAQITRESPAFINSMNTGFMAISNNIPIFVDEINKLKRANAELIAQGKPQVSVLKKIGAAFFSWQSLISVGIVLLTIFGPKLIKMAQAAINGAKGLDVLADAQEDINKAMGDSIGKFTALISVVKDSTKSEEDRLKAMQELNDEYPGFNAKILDEKDNIDLVNSAIDNYIIKLGQKAKAQAALGLLQEKFTEQIKIEENARKEIFEITGEENTSIERQKEIYDELVKSTSKLSRNRAKGGAQALKATKVNSILEDQAEIQDEINQLLDIYVKNVDFSDVKLKESSKKKKKNNKEETKFLFGSIGYLNDLIDLYEKLNKSTTDPKNREFLQGQIKQLNDLKDALNGISKDVPELAIDKFIPPADSFNLDEFSNEIARQLDLSEDFVSKAIKGYLDSGINDFKLFYKELEKLAKKNAEIRNEIEKQSFDLVEELTNSIFEIRINRIDAQIEKSNEFYDNEIVKAGEDESKKKALEEEKAIRERRLQKEKEKQEKKAFLFKQAFQLAEIVMDTAKAVAAIKLQASILAANPVTAPLASLALSQIPLAIQSGALAGSIVLAQSIPAFKEGGTMGYDGKALINDGGNREFVERNGQIFATPIKNAVVDLQKGDVIHKDMNALMNASIMTSLANDNKNLDSNKLKLIFDNNYAGLEKTIKNGFNNANVNTNVNLKGFDYVHQAYKESQSRWS